MSLAKRLCSWSANVLILMLLSFMASADNQLDKPQTDEVATGLDWDLLVFYTEEYPPYNYTENGEKKGFSIDLLLLIGNVVNADVEREEINIRPWSRAYRKVLKTKNTVLFSTARTKEREDLFKWVGPIENTRTVLISKKSSNIVIENQGDLNKYAVGVMIDDVGEQLLLDKGMSQDLLLYAYSNSALAKMLALERIDLWAYEERVALWSIEDAGFNPDDFEVVYVLDDVDMYYAFNLETNPGYINAIQDGLNKLRQRGFDRESIYEEVLSRYKQSRALSD